jgi:ubiquinone/menaquinone biosynthesis C-methylase UbiE
MPRIRTPWIFTLGAGIYDALTAQEPWRGHCREMGASLRGTRVLDLGIGPGVSGIELIHATPEMRLVGLDCSAPMLARARRHARAAGVALVRGDAALARKAPRGGPSEPFCGQAPDFVGSLKRAQIPA